MKRMGRELKRRRGKVGEAPPSVLAVFYYPFTVLMLKFSLHLSLSLFPHLPLGPTSQSHLLFNSLLPQFSFLKFLFKSKKKINISLSILTGFQFFTAPSLSSSWVYSVFNKTFFFKKNNNKNNKENFKWRKEGMLN